MLHRGQSWNCPALGKTGQDGRVSAILIRPENRLLLPSRGHERRIAGRPDFDDGRCPAPAATPLDMKALLLLLQRKIDRSPLRRRGPQGESLAAVEPLRGNTAGED